MIKIIFILMTLSTSTYSQVRDSVISYTSVELSGNVSKSELYDRARRWFVENFRDAREVLQITDRETGEVAGKGSTEIYVRYKFLGNRTDLYHTRFACNVWVKDGKYKYQFTDFEVYPPGKPDMSLGMLRSSPECQAKFPGVSQKKMNEMYQGAKEGVEDKVQQLIASLNEAMKKPGAGDF